MCVCVRQKSLCENEGKAARDGETKTGGRQAGSGDGGQRGGSQTGLTWAGGTEEEEPLHHG